MQLIKIVFVIAITMALSITLAMKSIGEVEEKPPFEQSTNDISTTLSNGRVIIPSKRLSRFLAEDQKNPRAADHCHKDNERCGDQDLQGNKNRTTACCSNKCMDLSSDKNNCGACKRKCRYTEDCCRGECVLLSFDKRHCGRCNHRCEENELCVYGLCGYP